MAEGRAMAVVGRGGHEKKHAGQAYELSGPRLMSFADAVADIAYGTSRDIRYTPRALLLDHLATRMWMRR